MLELITSVSDAIAGGRLCARHRPEIAAAPKAWLDQLLVGGGCCAPTTQQRETFQRTLLGRIAQHYAWHGSYPRLWWHCDEIVAALNAADMKACCPHGLAMDMSATRHLFSYDNVRARFIGWSADGDDDRWLTAAEEDICPMKPASFWTGGQKN